jgi:hypothetical protein
MGDEISVRTVKTGKNRFEDCREMLYNTLKRPSNPSSLKVSSRSFYHSALLHGTLCKKNFDNTTLFTPYLKNCFASFHLLNFTRNLKLIFSQLPFLVNFAPTRTASLVLILALCLSFIIIFSYHSPSPHLLLSILGLRTNLVYKQISKHSHV